MVTGPASLPPLSSSEVSRNPPKVVKMLSSNFSQNSNKKPASVCLEPDKNQMAWSRLIFVRASIALPSGSWGSPPPPGAGSAPLAWPSAEMCALFAVLASLSTCLLCRLSGSGVHLKFPLRDHHILPPRTAPGLRSRRCVQRACSLRLAMRTKQHLLTTLDLSVWRYARAGRVAVSSSRPQQDRGITPQAPGNSAPFGRRTRERQAEFV